jgi:SAM-dependent methyltransferase
LEHVPNPDIVIENLKNILADDGVVYIGFPNKNRMIGYMGTHNNVSFFKKIKWNFLDYWDRINGRFENSKGAHAGFSDKEFVRMAKPLFNIIIPVRNQYMLLKYPQYTRFIRLVISSGLSEFLFPSNYYLLKK